MSESDIERCAVTVQIRERWLYNALFYGRDTADFTANVETSLALLPETEDKPTDGSGGA